MGWTPDSKAIVFYAQGGLHRIDVAGKAVSAIPFHVKGARTNLPAVRLSVEVAAPEFAVKMLRGVTVSPQGDAVAYSTLGRIYVRSLPEGRPRRLTGEERRFEFMPAWSRDGKSIAYVAWDDTELGEDLRGQT